jgi:hypothetical protein
MHILLYIIILFIKASQRIWHVRMTHWLRTAALDYYYYAYHIKL